MKVICDRYDVCEFECIHKLFRDWYGFSYLENNYCDIIYENVNFLKLSDIRHKKLERIRNESR